ncbi:hypothetical protein BH23BAC1_BH23BAC1_46810 [soil metagenome]
MKNILLLFFFFAYISAAAQSSIHPEMDQVDEVTCNVIIENYIRFVNAYSRLDAKQISETFHNKGTEFYIGFPDQVPVIHYGKAAIFIHMNKDFVAAHSRSHKLKINFRLVERKTDGEKVYDVGFYQINKFTGKDTFTYYGKFAVVLVEDKDHQWKFLTEVNCPASGEEYEKVNYIKEINDEFISLSKHN